MSIEEIMTCLKYMLQERKVARAKLIELINSDKKVKNDRQSVTSCVCHKCRTITFIYIVLLTI